MDRLIGQNLGRYHVIEALGEGGMASVYKAFDTSLERHVAIKIIRSDRKEGTEQNEFLKRFQREAKALAQLDHPYILKVLDYGEQDGIPFLIMPFVQGGTLREKMGRPIPYLEAAKLLAPIAQALDYAHKRKVIHRDVKPANILLSESNTPILSDFGIAKIISSAESTQLTATGVGIGTPDYMAPEQWMGKSDARTDIYSLGIVFFQMVTGHLPFSAETPAAVLIKHMQDPLPRPRSFVADLPEAVEQVVFKALAKEPDNRFQDMSAFADALGKLAMGAIPSLEGIPQVTDTVLAAVPGISAQTRLGSVREPKVISTVKKKFPGWAIAVLIFGLLAVIVLFVVLVGGAFLASRMASQRKTPEVTATFTEIAPTLPTFNQGSALQPTAETFPIPIETSSGNEAFTSIDGFPDDIPILLENNGDLMKTTSQGMVMYIFSTNMLIKEVADFFLTGMTAKGWEMVSETTQADMYYWMFTKAETRQVMIALSTDETNVVQASIIIQTVP